jgi:hypothetical protein
MSNSLIIPNTVEIKVLDRETKEIVICEVSEFVLNQRMKFVRIVSDVLKTVYKDKSVVKNVEDVTTLFIQEAGEKLIDVYEMVLGKHKEWLLNNITPKNEIEIIRAIVEVNDFPFLMGQVKDLMNPMQKAAQKG